MNLAIWGSSFWGSCPCTTIKKSCLHLELGTSCPTWIWPSHERWPNKRGDMARPLTHSVGVKLRVWWPLHAPQLNSVGSWVGWVTGLFSLRQTICIMMSLISNIRILGCCILWTVFHANVKGYRLDKTTACVYRHTTQCCTMGTLCMHMCVRVCEVSIWNFGSAWATFVFDWQLNVPEK